MTSRINRWQSFYENIRDPLWPDCHNEYQFRNLPDHIQNEIIHVHDGQRYLALSDEDIEYYDPSLHQHNLYEQQPCLEYNKKFPIESDFFVYYNDNLEGDGTHNGQDFPNVIRYLYPQKRFNHCLDWCSGAGFIGFRMLSDDLCDKIILHDGFRTAVDACNYTINHMPKRYRDRVSTVCSDNLDWLTEDMAFDLVIGNPPPRRTWLDFPVQQHIGNLDYNRILVDPEWKCHRNFLQRIATKLATNGSIVIKNNVNFVSTQDYVELLQESGLVMKKAFREKFRPYMWYIEIGIDAT